MSTTISVTIVISTLAFGAVYEWGSIPLIAVAAGIGLVGLIKGGGVLTELRGLAIALTLVAVAILVQLVPISRASLDFLSPHAVGLLSEYSLQFALAPGSHSLSINPASTWFALFAFGGLSLYLLGLPRLLNRRDLETLPRNLIGFAVVLSLIGIFGREHNNGLVYGFWQPETGTNENGFGPFINRNHFAGWMLMVTCLSIGVLSGRLETAGRRIKPGLRNRIIWYSSAEASRVVLVAASVAVMAIALVWTISRSGIISFACAVICFLWLMARRRAVGRGRRAVVLATLGTVLCASLAWRGVDRLTQRFGDPTNLFSRFAAWRDGWDVVRDFLITGTGLNTYPDAMLFYQKNVKEFFMSHAHNDYLQFLAEGGLLVTLPALVVVAMLITVIRRRVASVRGDSYGYWVRVGAGVGLIAIAVQESVEFSLQMPANAFVFATLAAVAMAPARNAKAASNNTQCDPGTLTELRQEP